MMKVRRSTRLGVAAAALAMAVTGCSTSGSPADDDKSKGTGTILAAGPFSPTTLDPDPKGIVDQQTNFMISGQYTATLLSMQAPSADYADPLVFATDLKPDLAESYTELPSGLGYDFKLRSGVKSSVGNELTADDVAWTFQRMAATQGIGFILMLLGNVDTKNPITVKGPLEFTLNLTKPSATVIPMLQISAMGILDKKAVEDNAGADDPWGYEWLNTHTAGFGPYIVSSFESASQVTLEPNKNYYGAEPMITKVIFKQIPDSASRLQLLQGGEINLNWQTDPSQYDTLKSDPKVNVYFDHAPLFSRILPNFRSGSGPQTDRLVRQAVEAAVDRTSIATAVLPDQATAANSCVPNSISPPGFDGLTNTTADPEKAKELLAQAGFPDGITLNVATNYGVTIANLSATAQFLQTQLAKAGITLDVKSYPTQAAYLEATVNGGFELLMDTFQPFVGDAGFYMQTAMATGSAVNYGAYSNPDFDALVTQASAMAAGDERNQVLSEACAIAVDDKAVIPLVNIPTLTSTASSVKGVLDYPDLQLHFDKMSMG